MTKKLSVLALAAATAALASGAAAPPAHAYCASPPVAVDLGPLSGVDVPDTGVQAPSCINMLPCYAHAKVADTVDEYGVKLQPMECLM